MKLPKKVGKFWCPCMLCFTFNVYTKHRKEASYLYFQCVKCGKIIRQKILICKEVSKR